jgi:5-oxoprolinase (ATP-hydrolysing)
MQRDESKLEKRGWSFWIDRGGTFTDIIARDPDGRLKTLKRLSENCDGNDAALEGIKQLLAETNSNLNELESVRIGTTIGTNALLERNGERCVLVCTKGFADAVRIGYQNRPDIFALEIKMPQMIFDEVIEFDERIDQAGKILREPDLEKLKNDLEASFKRGIKSCAIVLMHAYRFPEHEIAAAKIANLIGFEQISMSHDCAALMKFISRADTTLADAYLTPLLRRYIHGLRKELGSARLQFMQSNGGLTEADLFRGKDSILSGPAGGLVGAIKVAAAAGFNKLITFDMGGTSTDVSHFAGEIEYVYDVEISGMRIRAPMMDIHTVAAGGGSILSFDGARYRVGPQSAGANPGPLSYRRNGPLALTDANVMLGRVQADYFPKIFGAQQNEGLDLASVQEAFARMAESIGEISGDFRSPEEVAFGFVKIAVSKMANAIKHVSVKQGHDARDCALVCFGGAGGQHACLIAEELGIRDILIHPLAGLLSAYGIGLADTRLIKDLDINSPLHQIAVSDLQASIKNETAKLKSILQAKGHFSSIQTSTTAHLQMDGSDYSLPVAFASIEKMKAEFQAKHLKRYGFIDQNRDLILSSLSIQVFGAEETQSQHEGQLSATDNSGQPVANTHSRFYCKSKDSEGWMEAPLLERHRLKVGEIIKGPALICEKNTTTIIDPAWQARILEEGTLHIFAEKEPSSSTSFLSGASKPDPITLEVFNNLFSFVAEQMGLTLQNTSQSVNIKERLDFSCAIFDADGNLVANAPHIPIHLGSMGESVKSLIANKGDLLRPGDAYAINDPYAGGTHLPDITVISPAFDESGKELLFFVASRGHHADIGGITPGSMPSDSHSIEEEGVLFRHDLVMREQHVLEGEIEKILQSSKYPARKISQNLADMRAQIAANARGISQLHELMRKWSKETVLAYMQFVQDNAEFCVRTAIKSLKSGSFSSTMDDGSKVCVEIRIEPETLSAEIDFSGTSAQTATNFNAPLAVCKAAVLYVFRTLVPDEIPLNAGCFKPLKVIVPEGCLLNPHYPAPVVAGNVETSQVIVDVLYGALGIMAASQGTMNNLTFGNERYQYYETICGGTGAGADFSGAGPVHSHMTNSRLTDPEVLESRFPVLLEQFGVRHGSGGSGRHHGGDGAIRRIRFLEEMTVSVLSNRRTHAPHGLAGGGNGSTGRNYIEHSGEITEIPFRASVPVSSGDSLTIETPGGGGYGSN